MSSGNLSSSSAPDFNELGRRALGTLALADSRGYNLTLENLSALLLGGPAEPAVLRESILRHEALEFDGQFAGLRGRLRTDKCARRTKANGKWLPVAMSIARRFAADYARICPHVRCVMLAGSAASGGFCDDDDIDLNIVVADGTKYTSYMTAVLLSLKYSLRHRKLLKGRYFPGLPKVICINVVWEEGQIRPFARKDEQVAFELLNSHVIFNNDFHSAMLAGNAWVADFFPQIYSRNGQNGPPEIPDGPARHPGPSPILESISKRMLFTLHGIVWTLRGKRPDLRERMVQVESVKRPYGIFDEPCRGADGRA
jgi:hypothetical protein